MSDVKQDRRQVCLNDEGRDALLQALRIHFPRYPMGVYPERWQEIAKVDRRTVDKMLVPEQRLRQASIDSIFKNLGAEFHEDQYLEQPSAAAQTLPSESENPLNGFHEQPNESAPAVPTHAPQGGKRPSRYAPVLAVALVCVVAFSLAYPHFHKSPISTMSSQQASSTDATDSQTPDPDGGMVLYDQFKADDTLRSDLWTVNGPASRSALSKFENPAYAMVAPKIVLDKDNGLGISGISGNGQQGAIESVRSFTPPFTVTALCNASSIQGDALRLVISRDDGKKGISLGFGSVDGSSEDADSGSFFCTAPNEKGGTWQQVGAPLSSLPPARDIWYVLTIVVDASGKATAAVSSGGFPIGTATANVGHGPFHVILAQEDGTQGSRGVNQAYCGTIQVINEAEE